MKLISIFSNFTLMAGLCFSAQAEQRSDVASNFFASCIQANAQAHPHLDELKRQTYCSCATRNFVSYGGEGAINDKTFAAFGLRKEYSFDAEERIKYASARAQENCLSRIR